MESKQPESSLALAMAAETVRISDLRRDAELQCRAKGTQRTTVTEYATSMTAGAIFPPVVVFRDRQGVLWLADGFHRCAAAEHAGVAELAADVREGGRRDALLYAAKANAEHGLRRTNADKRRAVLLVLAAFPKMSDRKIGEACGVDNKTVAAARRAQAPSEEIPQSSDDGPEAASKERAPADLSKVYLRTLRAHASEPAEHVNALVRAIVELHADTTPEMLVVWVQEAATQPAPAPAAPGPVTPRRRIVDPSTLLAGGGQ